MFPWADRSFLARAQDTTATWPQCFHSWSLFVSWRSFLGSGQAISCLSLARITSSPRHDNNVADVRELTEANECSKVAALLINNEIKILNRTTSLWTSQLSASTCPIRRATARYMRVLNCTMTQRGLCNWLIVLIIKRLFSDKYGSSAYHYHLGPSGSPLNSVMPIRQRIILKGCVTVPRVIIIAQRWARWRCISSPAGVIQRSPMYRSQRHHVACTSMYVAVP